MDNYHNGRRSPRDCCAESCVERRLRQTAVSHCCHSPLARLSSSSSHTSRIPQMPNEKGLPQRIPLGATNTTDRRLIPRFDSYPSAEFLGVSGGRLPLNARFGCACDIFRPKQRQGRIADHRQSFSTSVHRYFSQIDGQRRGWMTDTGTWLLI